MPKLIHAAKAAVLLSVSLFALPAGAAEPAATVSIATPPVPDVSQAAIEAATPEAWTARQAERAAGDAAERTDGTLSAPAPASPAEAKPNDGQAEKAGDAPDPFLVRMQVLLDRAHASPGVIDGLFGGNTQKAIRAYEEMRGLSVDGKPDADFWSILSADQGEAMQTYTITAEDVNGRYVPDLPSDYAELAKLDWLGYRGPSEMLAERFHLDEDLLHRLNPGIDFGKAGQTILVPDPGEGPDTKVARIVIDKERGELLAYGEDGALVLVDPATIGSEDTPSPSGVVKVNGSAPDPKYSYDPKKNFQQGKNHEKLTLPGGPNGPVGDIWIDLSKPTYGIHGTPEPSKIDKTASHGCVRLTNWDAKALSKLVMPAKTVVEFKS